MGNSKEKKKFVGLFLTSVNYVLVDTVSTHNKLFSHSLSTYSPQVQAVTVCVYSPVWVIN
jgi:hypothetical protein